MGLRDFIVTPIFIIIILALAYVIRPQVTYFNTRKYFLPALLLKMFGAIALGLIYQFYYAGGDTFTYHTHGSRPLWEAFMKSPYDGVKMFFSHGTYGPGLWEISENI